MDDQTSGITCLVTIHGIGFLQPPEPGVAGYADDLHRYLYAHLPGVLSDDPERHPYQVGESVPIYVHSSSPSEIVGRRTVEAGLKRLGSWSQEHPGEVDSSHAQLVKQGATIAHIALVYSELEGKEDRVVPTMMAALMGLASLLRGNYDSPFRLVRRLFRDLRFARKAPGNRQAAGQRIPVASLRVRQDTGMKTVLTRRKSKFKRRPPAIPDHFKTVFQQVQDDVAAYVCLQEQREAIQSFVVDALMRLASRRDVARIVLHAHSNGSIIAFDALCRLPPEAASKIPLFVTAGCPLRKYVTLLHWGQEMPTLAPSFQWINFWDKRDPAADPLMPCFAWRPNTEPTPEQLTGLLWRHDPQTGKQYDASIQDIQVQNANHISGGAGLVAHNYWDNIEQFIRPLANRLSSLAQGSVNTQAPVGLSSALHSFP